MKYILTILTFVIGISTNAQWSARWNRLGSADSLQSSPDGKTWSIVGILKTSLDSNSMAITGPTFYYRVIDGSSSTNTVLVSVVLSVGIINPGIITSTSFVQIYWTSQNESNLKNYEIDRSFDGITFTAAATGITPKGNTNYSVNINRPTITTKVCSFKMFGRCWGYKTTTTIDSRKGIYQIISISSDGSRKVLATVSG